MTSLKIQPCDTLSPDWHELPNTRSEICCTLTLRFWWRSLFSFWRYRNISTNVEFKNKSFRRKIRWQFHHLGRTFRETNVQLNCLSGVRIGAANESSVFYSTEAQLTWLTNWSLRCNVSVRCVNAGKFARRSLNFHSLLSTVTFYRICSTRHRLNLNFNFKSQRTNGEVVVGLLLPNSNDFSLTTRTESAFIKALFRQFIRQF